MNISLILAHPNEQSFNHAIATQAMTTLRELDHQVFFHDLYQEKFDPILPFEEFEEVEKLPVSIQKYCTELITSDVIIIVHPNWWGQPPAILKGWIDRVIRPGVAYQFLEGDKGEGIPVGLLKARIAIVFNTSNTPAEREINIFGDPLERLWKDCVFGLCGIKFFHRDIFRVMVTSTLKQRKMWLRHVEQVVKKYAGQVGNLS